MSTLREQLQRIKENSSKRIPPEFQPIMQRAAEQLRQSGIAARSLHVGGRAPEFSLPDVNGKIISSAELLANGPLVVSFYRGKR